MIYFLILSFVIFLFLWWIFYGYFFYLKGNRIHKHNFDIQIKDQEISKKISVIVVSHNEQVLIKSKIDNLRKIKYDNFEVCFVDSSTDSTADTIKREIEGVVNFKLISNASIGRSEQINLGLDNTDGEYVVITDADASLNENILLNINRALSTDGVGAVAAWIEPATGYNPDINFWKFYNNTRYLEGLNGFCPIASGACYAFLRDLVGRIPEDVWADDVYVPLYVHFKGKYCVCLPQAIAHELRGPGNFKGLIFNKIRKACDIIKEFLRFLPQLSRANISWKIIYITKIMQIVFSPFALIAFLLLTFLHPVFMISLWLILVMPVIFVRSRSGNGMDYEHIRIRSVLLVVFVTEVVLFVAFFRYLFNNNKHFYRHTDKT